MTPYICTVFMANMAHLNVMEYETNLSIIRNDVDVVDCQLPLITLWKTLKKVKKRYKM